MRIRIKDHMIKSFMKAVPYPRSQPVLVLLRLQILEKALIQLFITVLTPTKDSHFFHSSKDSSYHMSGT